MEEGGGFFSEDAGDGFDVVVEAWVGEDLEAGVDGAAARIVCSVNEFRDAGLNHRAGAHGAGFKRNVQRGA